ncbi:MAG TPA: hypothetical protein VK427_13220 [Kofleriaceae bacterium]|nr:hypothetical protein [Kofleriaceae bacterium]
MMEDPGVRSVRVAAALCDRFAALVRGPSTLTARQQSGAPFRDSPDEEALSLRIGEVQQLYPEIWRHLDDARAAFAKRGADVSAYDAIRTAEGSAMGATVELARERHAFGQYAADETVKSANFNRVGYERARKAMNALMNARPDVPWAAIARAEAEDPNIAAFRRSTMIRRWIMFGLLAIVLASPVLYVLYTQHQQHKRAEALYAASVSPEPMAAKHRPAIERAKASYAAARSAWPAATERSVLAALQPSERPCEYAFTAPSEEAKVRFVLYGDGSDASFQRSAFVSYTHAGPIGDQRLAQAARRISLLERVGGRDAPEVLRALPTHVVFLVIDREIEPAPGEGTTYTPGEVAGRAYVFSVATRAVVCAGTVAVKNAPGLAPPPQDSRARDFLFRDLEIRLREAIAANLRAI